MDPKVLEVVEQFHRQHQRETYAEQWAVAATDRTMDVVACIGEPFFYSDVYHCVALVLVRDGWVAPDTGDTWHLVRRTVRDLEDAELITRIRGGGGPRPHLWVRAHGRRYYRKDGNPV